MRVVALFVVGGVTDAYRVSSRTSSGVLERVESPHNCYWPPSLTAEGYTGEHAVGAGATACVFLAEDASGMTVAVKSSKLPGTLAFWKHECATMEELRIEACHHSRQIHYLAQMYLPTCISVGGDDEHAYYVMHAAGTEDMETIRSRGLSVQDQKQVFAEMLGAFGTLHTLGHAHCDLHGHNIVLDGTQLALIDYGSMRPLERAKTHGYKRDGNAVWRWTAEIAGCDADALWQEGEPEAMRLAKPKLLQCLQDKWGADDEFIAAMEMVCDADIAQTIDQHIVSLFQTSFVQNNLPEFRVIYPWHNTDGCLAWDERHWHTAEDDVHRLEADFTGMTVYKCETVPTWDATGPMTCRYTPDKPACFSTHKGVYWSCMPGITFLGDCTTTPDAGGHNMYSGHCVMSGHVNYAQAIDFDPSTFHEREATQSTVSIGNQIAYRCESVPTWDDETGVTCRLNIFKAACFSLQGDMNWICAGSDGLHGYCSTIPMPDSTETYDGACLMEGHANWGSTVEFDASTFVKEVPPAAAPGSCRRRRCSA